MSSGSMSVHSLIDRFQNESDPQARVSRRSPDDKTGQKPPSAPPSIHHQSSLERAGVLSILGSDVKSFPFTEDAFNNAVKLKIEQERTKQDSIRLEIANKNLNILTLALNAHIPNHLIPQMCVNLNHMSDSEIEQTLKKHTASSSQDYSTAPVNYRFGGAPAISPGTAPQNAIFAAQHQSFTRRPLSPAKLGAAAVANLASPTLPYRFPPGTPSNRKLRIPPKHQRHFSMPSESAFQNRNPRSGPIELAKVDTSLHPPTNASSQQASPQPSPQNAHTRSRSVSSTSMGSKLNSPIGTTSSMQVKPTPAQPLSRQAKMNNQPSQESMTSFQHIIQFHHWKPESPGAFEAYQQKVHKRRKSDNMSVDMGRTSITEENETMPDDDEDDEEEDVTMETSMTETIPKPLETAVKPASRIRGSAKYPHNILSAG